MATTVGVGVSTSRGLWGVKETTRPMVMLMTTRMLIIQNIRWLREADVLLRRIWLTDKEESRRPVTVQPSSPLPRRLRRAAKPLGEGQG